MEQSPSAGGTIEKALDVLFHLHASDGAQGVTAVGRALGLPKSSAHRLLQALGHRGLVERDARGRYRPGMGLVALGLGILEREPVVEAARPVLERMADDLGETLFLAGARAGRLHVLDQVQGPGFLRAAPRVGETIPVHATAAGKLYLAFAPGQVEQDAAPWERFTEHTLGGRALLAATRQARRRGWAANREEWSPGLTAVAAPVFLGARMVAALAAAGPSARLGEGEIPALGERLVSAAVRVGARLDGSAPAAADAS